MNLRFNVLADPGNATTVQFDQSEIESLVVAQGCKIVSTLFFNGGVVVGDATSTHNAQQPELEVFFPNPSPAGQAVTIEIEGWESGRFIMYNISGQVIENRMIQGSQHQIMAPSPGIYLLELENEKGQRTIKKLISY
jgi:hypothetical protein